MSVLNYLPRRLSHFEIFFDSRPLLGKCEEFEPPKFEMETADYRGSNSDVPQKYEKGMKELEAKFVISEYDHLIMNHFLSINEPVSILARGALTSQGVSGYAQFSMRGIIYNMEQGKWKSGDDSKLSFSLSCTYVRLEIDGLEILEIDIPNMVRKIGGKDQLAMARAAILKA